ncbi:ATP synthase F1 subunit delta [Leuconostocaceae bacterium ESL0723]|nr:ATP synthase F1 subunit delta [Lactobacillaceae bacterium L1_55_11]WEV54473.1 ATP synthase F1 subunit delta [Leuconostocaceae bacterium ESL0723]
MAKKIDAVADEYAQALLDLAQEQDQVPAVLADVNALAQILEETPQVLTVLTTRGHDYEQRKALVETLFKGASESVVNLIRLMDENQRLAILPDVLASFIHQYRVSQGIVAVTVTSAVALDDDQKQNLEQAFLARSGAKKLETSYAVDPEILGGVIMQSPSLLVDGSLQTKIAKLKAQLLG